MSKLIKLLEQLGRENPPRLGFGMKPAQKPNPEMLLLGCAKDWKSLDKKNISGIDGIIFGEKNQKGTRRKPNSSFLEGIPWGVILESPTEKETSELLKQGCDFIALSSLNVKVEATKEEELGHFLFMPSGLSQDDQQALAGLPIDGIFVDSISTEAWTLEELLLLSKLRKEIGKTFILKINIIPSSWELECLHNIGIDGLIIEIESQTDTEINTLSTLIQGLPKKSNQRDKLIPSLGNLSDLQNTLPEEDEDEDEDEDF